MERLAERYRQHGEVSYTRTISNKRKELEAATVYCRMNPPCHVPFFSLSYFKFFYKCEMFNSHAGVAEVLTHCHCTNLTGIIVLCSVSPGARGKAERRTGAGEGDCLEKPGEKVSCTSVSFSKTCNKAAVHGPVCTSSPGKMLC